MNEHRPINPWPATLDNIRSVLDWQQAGFVHPLTCGISTCREDLLPTVSWLPDGDPQLLLICPKCSNIQVHIPGCVITGPREKAFTYMRDALSSESSLEEAKAALKRLDGLPDFNEGQSPMQKDRT